MVCTFDRKVSPEGSPIALPDFAFLHILPMTTHRGSTHLQNTGEPYLGLLHVTTFGGVLKALSHGSLPFHLQKRGQNNWMGKLVAHCDALAPAPVHLGAWQVSALRAAPAQLR